MPAPSCLKTVLRVGLFALPTILFVASAGGATVPGMYDATVALSERTERGQALAFQDAMRQVLVRVTGRRDAGNEPAFAALVNDARRYVQQFRVVGTNQFQAGFDGARIERAVMDAGQPLWGHERPATLVLLTSGEGSARTLVTAESTGELKTGVVRAAQLRGLPLLWPSAARPVSVAELGDGSSGNLAPLMARFGADAALVGVAANPSTGGVLRWTLVQGSEANQWRGSAEEGPQGAADVLARLLASQSSDEGSLVAIAVSGINDLRSYATVTDYLQSLTLVRSLAVDEIAGDNVIYRARVQGGGERLARAIGLGGRLEPQNAGNGRGDDSGGVLAYRYRQ